jgi:galactokinase
MTVSQSVESLGPDALRLALMQRYPETNGRGDEIRIVRAPGRVNLIGEHTDYNDGYVLPVAIDLEIRIASVTTDDDLVGLTRLDTDETGALRLGAEPAASGSWLDYVAGVAIALRAAGQSVHGLRGVLVSDLPISAGLSSSAALEVAAAWALSGPAGPNLGGPALAAVAQRGENDHVGVRCGIMDQFASACGEANAALLLDCRTTTHRSVPLPLGDHVLVAIDSRTPRRLAASAYNDRRAACDRAVEIIARGHPDIRSLRDLDHATLVAVGDDLDPITRRRCEHVIDENARVLDAAAAFERADLATIGRLFAESHASLRDLYEVSSPELDTLVEIAMATPGVVASRMTGAGFGGCTINIVHRDALSSLRDRIAVEYPSRTGRAAEVHVVTPSAGAGQIA